MLEYGGEDPMYRKPSESERMYCESKIERLDRQIAELTAERDEALDKLMDIESEIQDFLNAHNG